MEFKQEINKFVLYNDDGKQQIGYITFKLDKSTLIILHTFVSPLFQGQGMAKILIEKVINYAKEQKFMIKPVCSYSVSYFEKHPEYLDIIVK